jgi:hypothetical protein
MSLSALRGIRTELKTERANRNDALLAAILFVALYEV